MMRCTSGAVTGADLPLWFVKRRIDSMHASLEAGELGWCIFMSQHDTTQCNEADRGIYNIYIVTECTHYYNSTTLEFPTSCVASRIFERPVESRRNLSRQCIPCSRLIPSIMIIRIPLPLMLQLVVHIITLNPIPKSLRPEPCFIPLPQLPVHPIPQSIRWNPCIWVRRLSNQSKPNDDKPNAEPTQE